MYSLFTLVKTESSPVREFGFRNLWNLCFWNSESWALVSEKQLNESGIPLTIRIQNPGSTDWNKVPGIRNPRLHGTQIHVLNNVEKKLRCRWIENFRTLRWTINSMNFLNFFSPAKVLHDFLFQCQDRRASVDKFQQECRILQWLKHKNVVELVEFRHFAFFTSHTFHRTFGLRFGKICLSNSTKQSSISSRDRVHYAGCSRRSCLPALWTQPSDSSSRFGK